jgi:formate dehydrogenase subunit gamma
MSLQSADLIQVQHILARLGQEPGALLPVLHAVQEALGFVPKDAVPVIAEALNLSRAEVHGVVTYYHFFRSEKPGQHVVQVCRAEACQACGADDLMAQAEKIFGCKTHRTRADGAVSLEPIYCLGLCALSPAVMVDDKVHGRVTPQKLQSLAAAWKVAA